MTLGELMQACKPADGKHQCVSIEVRDARNSIMISADLDYMEALIKDGDKRMGMNVKRWEPSMYSRHTKSPVPQVTVYLEA